MEQVVSYFFVVDEDYLSADILNYDVSIQTPQVISATDGNRDVTFEARKTQQQNWFELLVSKPGLDFESQQEHMLMFTITDLLHDDWTLQQQVTLRVTNVFEPPQQVSLDGGQISENAPANTYIGQFFLLESKIIVTSCLFNVPIILNSLVVYFRNFCYIWLRFVLAL